MSGLNYNDLPPKAQEELRRQNPDLDPAGHAFGEPRTRKPKPIAPPHAPRRRRASPPPARPRARARQAARYVRKTAATAQTVAPAPVKGGLSLLYGALTGGVALAMLYLLLTRPGVATKLLGLFGNAFQRVVSPTTSLFEKAPPAGDQVGGTGADSQTINAWLAAGGPSSGQTAPPAVIGAGVTANTGVTAAESAIGGLSSFFGGAKATAGTVAQTPAQKAAVAALGKIPQSFPGYHFDPSTDQLVPN